MSAKPFSLSFGSKSKPTKPSASISKPVLKKPALVTHESDGESDHEGAAQEVSHFDAAAGGAIHESQKKEEKQPLVIQSQANRDWQEEAKRKRQRGALPGQDGRDGSGKGVDLELMEREAKEKLARTKMGLNVMKKEEELVEVDAQGDAEVVEEKVEVEIEKKPMTDDERALAALLGEKPKSDLVLGSQLPETEEQAFKNDYREAPSAPTLADYTAVPVEEFGAALLRGMGWKDGESIGGKPAPKAEDLQRRPALLGIGAKAEAAVGVELGEWGQGTKGKSKRKIDQEYTPVLLRNKVTGEQMTEEELKKKLEKEKDNSKMILTEREKDRSRHASDREYDSSSRKHRRHYDDDEYDSRDSKRSRRDRERDYDYEKKHKSSRRDRSESPEDKYRSRGEKDRDHDRKHKSSRRERSYTPEDKYSRRKDRDRKDRHREYDDDRHRSSKRDRSRSKERRRDYDDDRRDRKERKEYKEKSHRRDRDDRY